jgi:uncharacterized protein YdhG (YjbR/CyaY superfamily)
MEKSKPNSIDEYMVNFPKETQLILEEIRKTIQKTAPNASETISYGMPAFKQNGKVLIYFAAYPHHIGLYATPQGHEAFKADLAKYKQGKGSVQFPINQPMPLALIARIVKFRVEIIVN